jgi:DNA polymerase-3 subunit alpha
MKIAQVLAGYSLGEADFCAGPWARRRRRRWTSSARASSGASEKGVSEEQAGGIFDLVAKFAGYGFNKSHAAAYALISYPDRLAEGQPSRRVHGRLHVARPQQHRQARCLLSGCVDLKCPSRAPDVNRLVGRLRRGVG